MALRHVQLHPCGAPGPDGAFRAGPSALHLLAGMFDELMLRVGSRFRRAEPQRHGATSRHAGRSRVFRSYVSSPASRWRAVAVLERAAECRLRRVADVLRDERDRKGGVAELVGGGVQAYVREIGGWRLPDASDEPRSERRPGKAA